MKQFESSGENDLRKLPPSRSGLLQHAKRAALQAGYVWKECEKNTVVPDPRQWGYMDFDDTHLAPRWQAVPSPVQFIN